MKSISLTFLRFKNERLVSKENVLLHQWRNETLKHGIKPESNFHPEETPINKTELSSVIPSQSKRSKRQPRNRFQVEICPL